MNCTPVEYDLSSALRTTLVYSTTEAQNRVEHSGAGYFTIVSRTEMKSCSCLRWYHGKVSVFGMNSSETRFIYPKMLCGKTVCQHMMAWEWGLIQNSQPSCSADYTSMRTFILACPTTSASLKSWSFHNHDALLAMWELAQHCTHPVSEGPSF